MALDSHGKAKKVLVFGRRRQFKRLVDMASKLFPNAQIDMWSDERLGGEIHWWGKKFYSHFSTFKKMHCEDVSDQISIENLSDVTKRCRFLRELPADVAGSMLLAGHRTWSDVLIGHEYDVILSQAVDSYVIDLLERVSSDLLIPFVSTVTTPFSGRIRLTRRGELWGENLKHKNDIECLNDSINSLMKNNYRADILIGANSVPYATVIRRLLIDSLKPMAFFLYRFLSRDSYSFSFPSRNVYRGRMVAELSRAVSALKMESEAKAIPSSYVFIPLQFYPEATTDYWVSEVEMIDHQAVVLRIVQALSELNMSVVLKEHPAAVGRRSSEFVAKLMKYSNVFFAPLLHPVGELVANSSLVIGAGTTTMLQALLMEKPALFCGTPFYGTGGAPVLSTVANIDDVKQKITQTLENYSCLGVDGVGVVEAYFKSSAKGSIGRYALIGETAVSVADEVLVSDDLLAVLDDALSSCSCSAS